MVKLYIIIGQCYLTKLGTKLTPLFKTLPVSLIPQLQKKALKVNVLSRAPENIKFNTWPAADPKRILQIKRIQVQDPGILIGSTESEESAR